MRTPAPKTRTVAYIRVSTLKQADDGYGLEAQRRHVIAYADLYGLDLVEIVEDGGASAKSLDRPGLQRVLAMVARGEVEAVLVAKLDRLTRSVVDLGVLLEDVFQKVALLSVGEQIDTRTAAGRLVLNILTSVSSWEREACAERTRAALAVKRTRGEPTGHAPYGKRVEGGKLVDAPEEQQNIETIRALAAQGLSSRAIARRMNDLGLRSRPQQGSDAPGDWHHPSVRRILAAGATEASS